MQVDGYEGIRPNHVIQVENPDVGDKQQHTTQYTLDDYTIGTNGTLFSPQGGLRIAPHDLAQIGILLSNGGKLNGIHLLNSATVAEMLNPIWRFNSSNGNNYAGLMRCYSLSVQHITNKTGAGDGDRLVANIPLNYVGHCGDAYGLLSGLWFDPTTASGFVYCISGVGADPETYGGEYSSFSRWEEQIMTALYQLFGV